MKFDQIQTTATVLTSVAAQQLKGGSSNAEASTSIIITEDINEM